MARGTIFEFVGGPPAFVALAAANHERCLADPLLNHPFSHGGQPDHVERLAGYWAEVFGGPPAYSRSHGGHPGMLDVHAGEGIDAEYGAAFAACFLQAVDDAGWPADAELRAVLRQYIDWAVADVMAVSPVDAVVPTDLPMPSWSWDGPKT